MTNYDLLIGSTRRGEAWLRAAPVIQQALRGDVTRDVYLAFLAQAYQHVRHTVPLLMAVGSRIGPEHDWLQREIVHYIEEEVGHDSWILNDIEAAGGDPQQVRLSRPAAATDAMIAYAYDTVMRRQCVGFFGMVFVLEGTSVALALAAADSLQTALRLPDRAFTYLRSHGRLDQQHIGQLRSIIDRLDPRHDMPAVLTCASTMFWLYGSVFRGLESSSADQQRRHTA